MKRTSRAAFTAAALLSCTLTFSGCSVIKELVPPDQDSESAEQADADGQQREGGGENEQEANETESGSDSDSSGSSSDETEGTSDSGDDTTNDGGTSGSDADQSSGSKAEVSLSENFEDPQMEDKIEVLSAVRDFDSSKRASTIKNGGEVVLLEVRITPGQKYSGLIQAGAFKISDDGGEYRYEQTSGVEDEMKAAGFDPLEDVARRDGGTHEGWIAYVPTEKQDTYKIRYERGAGKVMGTEEKVPEFTKTFDIPAA